jgi:hypothetical protein
MASDDHVKLERSGVNAEQRVQGAEARASFWVLELPAVSVLILVGFVVFAGTSLPWRCS